MIADLFKLAQQVVQEIQNHGFQAYIVGGAVRDSILGRDIDDIDIATSAYPEQVQKMFTKVIPTGIEHGTVLVRYHGTSFEVTTFRTETGYSDFRRPDTVNFVTNLKEDLARRDFTMNAIAMDQSLQLIDPYHGQSDIKNKVIRTVGRAQERFLEDPLRMMRAIRFQSQLGFKLDNEPLDAIHDNKKWLEKIAVERIAVEWEKTLTGTYFNEAKQSLFHTGLVDHLPILSEHINIQLEFQRLNCSLPSFAAFIAYMNLNIADIAISDWTNRWKLSNQIKKDSHLLVQLVQDYPKEPLSWVLYRLPEDLIEDFSRLCLLLQNEAINKEDIIAIKNGLTIKNRRDLVINGQDIISFFPDREAGSWIQHMLLETEKAVISEVIKNDKNDIREWLQYDNK
ncbi:tRNA nucleotidyltransferase (CCA-adding enzyme) [Gracilibacillus orientalis]|uniref:CCA-adding enzyme n=1 Tax=Gracilibacillus orientalis TaxID=334253 RepID=A0A1I4L350_9BACI|nr:CCA tRNA nucleotidyltransferase [Gracilibacillus orientalis]SFL85460.1 tRNA nucleotidyltransferase (CCA-adding enzyme) [Gracilibacillus orientalis]